MTGPHGTSHTASTAAPQPPARIQNSRSRPESQGADGVCQSHLFNVNSCQLGSTPSCVQEQDSMDLLLVGMGELLVQVPLSIQAKPCRQQACLQGAGSNGAHWEKWEARSEFTCWPTQVHLTEAWRIAAVNDSLLSWLLS